MGAQIKTYKKNSTIVKLEKAKKERKEGNHERNLRVKQIVREATGFNAMDRHILELLRLGKDRAALRFANTRIGKFQLAKKKIEELDELK